MDIQAAKKRCEAATKGPWHYAEGEFNAEPATDELGSIVGDDWMVAAIIDGAGSHGGPDWDVEPRANAEFIAHARSDLPAALEALEEAQAEKARLQARVEALEARQRLDKELIQNGLAAYRGLTVERDRYNALAEQRGEALTAVREYAEKIGGGRVSGTWQGLVKRDLDALASID